MMAQVLTRVWCNGRYLGAVRWQTRAYPFKAPKQGAKTVVHRLEHERL